MVQLPHPISENIVREILDACHKHLQDEHIVTGGMLGCGDFGCVYETTDGRALKITKHKKEADVAYWLLAQPEPHIAYPDIYGVWEWTDCHPYDNPIYIILREEIGDLQGIDIAWLGSILDDFEYKLFQDAIDKVLTEDQIYEALADVFAEIPGLAEDEIRVEQQLGDLFVWNMHNDLWLDDVIIDNLGQRADGTIVIRDLGTIKIL